MSKLIKSNFYNLFKSRYFYIILLVSAVIGAGLTIGMYYSNEISIPDNAEIVVDEANILAVVPNLAGFVIPFASAATVGLFLEAEYTQGTIRNKIICGYERSKIFFSQLVTVCAATVIYFAAFEAAVLSITVFVFDYDGILLKAAAVSLGTMLLMLISASTVLSFMIGSFIHGGKLIVLLLGVQYAMNFFLFFGLFKGSSKIFDYLSRIAPQGTTLTMACNAMPDKAEINCVISLILIAVFIVTGLLSFKKHDIA